jgi:hypothetical protein
MCLGRRIDRDCARLADLHPFKPLKSRKLYPGVKVEPGPGGPGSTARKLAA